VLSNFPSRRNPIVTIKYLVIEVQAQPEDLLKYADSYLRICRGVSGTPNAIMSKQVSPWFQFDNRALSSNLWWNC
jgi:hypothetical protein